MRIKIFFFPAAIVVSLWMFIQLVWPEFSNIGVNKEALKKEEAVLLSAQEKSENINALAGELDTHKEVEASVLKYLPQSSAEEFVISAIGVMTRSSGVAVSDVSIEIEQGSSDGASGSNDTKGSEVIFAQGNAGMGDSAAASEAPPAEPLKERFVTATFSVTGTYESIKTVLQRVAFFERKHSIREVNIAVVENESSGEEGAAPPPSGNLSLDVTTEFVYAPEAKISKEQTAAIFSKKSFDFSAIMERDQASLEMVPWISVPQTGRENPFLP